MTDGNAERGKAAEMVDNSKKIDEFNTLLLKEYIDMIHNKIWREQFLIKKNKIDSEIQALKNENVGNLLLKLEQNYDMIGI